MKKKIYILFIFISVYCFADESFSFYKRNVDGSFLLDNRNQDELYKNIFYLKRKNARKEEVFSNYYQSDRIKFIDEITDGRIVKTTYYAYDSGKEICHINYKNKENNREESLTYRDGEDKFLSIDAEYIFNEDDYNFKIKKINKRGKKDISLEISGLANNHTNTIINGSAKVVTKQPEQLNTQYLFYLYDEEDNLFKTFTKNGELPILLSEIERKENCKKTINFYDVRGEIKEEFLDYYENNEHFIIFKGPGQENSRNIFHSFTKQLKDGSEIFWLDTDDFKNGNFTWKNDDIIIVFENNNIKSMSLNVPCIMIEEVKTEINKIYSISDNYKLPEHSKN